MSSGAVQFLQKSLQDAHKSLEYSSNALKKLTGRDPAVPPLRSGPTPERRRSGGGRLRAWSGDYDGPASKRRDSVGGRSRLAGRLGPPVRRESGGERGELREEGRWRGEEGELRGQRRRGDSDGEDQDMEEESKPSLQSSVVATTVPPRPSADPADSGKSKMRNRRMFGFLMGTLQKFKDTEEASKVTEKEKTRKAIEKKVEEAEEEEKAAAVQEKRELFQRIKNEKMRVTRIENHLETVAEYEEWNEHCRMLRGYIQTRNKPPICYLPAQHNTETTAALKRTVDKIEGVIKERQAEIDAMLSEDVGGGGGGEGKEGDQGGEMDTSSQEAAVPAVVVVASRVREGGARSRGEGSESGEASESD